METHQLLWDFAVERYELDGVKEACLSLQDEYGVDIPVLLFLLWVHENFKGDLGRFCTAAIEETRDWQQSVIQPLRAARRAAKENSTVGSADYYETTKKVELEAERRQLLHLERLANESLVRLDDGETNSKEICDVLLSEYFEGLGVIKWRDIRSYLGIISA